MAARDLLYWGGAPALARRDPAMRLSGHRQQPSDLERGVRKPPTKDRPAGTGGVQRDPFARDVIAELVARSRWDAVGRELRAMTYRAGLPT